MTSVPSVPEKLTEKQRNALISLLADEDPAVYQAVRTKLLSCGQISAVWLRPHMLSNDPLVRRRAHEIINVLARQLADQRFMSFCLRSGDDLDLEEGVWLLAQTHYPEINIAAYQALFDNYAAELRERIDFGADARAVLHGINQYLFEELNFAGNEQNYYDPDNSYLNRVVDQRIGNPISLCTVLLLVGRRLKMPLRGIGLPGHFMCRYQSPTVEIYIDAFNRGKFWSKADCIKYLLQTQHRLEEGFLSPISPRKMLLRMCANLHQVYRQHELSEEAARLQRYWIALGK